MKNGKLNQREKATLTKALMILSDWTEYKEEANGRDYDLLLEEYQYSHAMNAIVGLSEFLAEEDKER